MVGGKDFTVTADDKTDHKVVEKILCDGPAARYPQDTGGILMMRGEVEGGVATLSIPFHTTRLSLFSNFPSCFPCTVLHPSVYRSMFSSFIAILVSVCHLFFS